jgi:hypothetical protein
MSSHPRTARQVEFPKNSQPRRKKVSTVDTCGYPNRYCTCEIQLLHGRQVGREGQLARRVANVHLLLGAGDDPVLRSHIPVGQVTAGQGRSPLDLLAGGDGNTVKGTEDSDGIILAAKGDILETKVSIDASFWLQVPNILTSWGTSSPTTEPVLVIVAVT